MAKEYGRTARPIRTDDIESAIRGLGMARMNVAQLRMLAKQHEKQDAFASAVIERAALQVIEERNKA